MWWCAFVFGLKKYEGIQHASLNLVLGGENQIQEKVHSGHSAMSASV
jgi:hypothetical protein